MIATLPTDVKIIATTVIAITKDGLVKSTHIFLVIGKPEISTDSTDKPLRLKVHSLKWQML